MDINAAKTASRAQWFTITTRVGEFEALVEPFGNKEWRKIYGQLSKPYTRYMRKNDGNLPQSKSDEIHIECAAKALIKDWRGITDGEAEVPFSEEAAVELLTDVEEARNGISKAALDLAEVYTAEREDAEGN